MVSEANRKIVWAGGGLVAIVAVLLGIALLTSGDESALSDSTVTSVTTRPGAGAVVTLARPNEPLTVMLSAGTAQNLEPAEAIAVVEGVRSTDDTVAAIIARLPEWLLPEGDHLDFNRPAETLKPPLVGDTIDVPFPAGTDEPAPVRSRGPAGSAPLSARGRRRHRPVPQCHVQPADGAALDRRATGRRRCARHHHARVAGPLAVDRHPNPTVRV